MDNQSEFERLGNVCSIDGDKLNPMPEEEIVKLEGTLGAQFPETFRRFLATYGATRFNGRSPDHPYVVFRPLTPLPLHITDDGTALFGVFYGRNRTEGDSYGLAARARYFSGRLPKNLIPIGDDGGKGLICLGIKGQEAGNVYYWDQENEQLDEDEYAKDFGEPRSQKAMFQNVYLIAASFEDFLRRLEIMPD